MTHVFHRQARATPPVAVLGDGVHIVDAAGKRYLDASGGAAVSCRAGDEAGGRIGATGGEGGGARWAG